MSSCFLVSNPNHFRSNKRDHKQQISPSCTQSFFQTRLWSFLGLFNNSFSTVRVVCNLWDDDWQGCRNKWAWPSSTYLSIFLEELRKHRDTQAVAGLLTETRTRYVPWAGWPVSFHFCCNRLARSGGLATCCCRWSLCYYCNEQLRVGKPSIGIVDKNKALVTHSFTYGNGDVISCVLKQLSTGTKLSLPSYVFT